MGDAGSQLTKRGHLLSLNQVRLSRFQVAIGGFGRIASSVDLGFRALAFSDVAINQDEATIRHGISADLDHPTIGPCSLLSKLLLRVFKTAAHFRLNVFG